MDYLRIGLQVKLKSGITGQIIGIWHDDPDSNPQYGIQLWNSNGVKETAWYYETDFEILDGE